MEVLSFLVLILLCLLAYSVGAVAKAGKAVELRPKIVDLVLVLVILAGAVCFRVYLDLNRWLVVLAWVFISGVIGMSSIWPRKLSTEKISGKQAQETIVSNLPMRIWRAWSDFFRRTGEFNSRMVLSLFYFAMLSPWGFAISAFSDPLRTKHRGAESYWLQRPSDSNRGLERSRKQF